MQSIGVSQQVTGQTVSEYGQLLIHCTNSWPATLNDPVSSASAAREFSEDGGPVAEAYGNPSE